MNQPNETKKPYTLPVYYQGTGHFDLSDFPAETFRIVIISSDSGIIRFNGETRLLLAPMVLCLNAVDTISFDDVTGLQAEALAFHPTIINHRFDFFREPGEPVSYSLTESLERDNLRPFIKRNSPYAGQYSLGPATLQQLRQLISYLVNQLETRPDGFWPCRSRSFLLELLFILFQLSISNNWLAEFGLKTESRLGHRIVLYLTNHYSRKITIAELTKQFNLNRNSLYQEFQQTTGLSLIAYLIRLRIKMAAVLLAETSMPVAEVMERVGYTDLTHFGRAFKKITGFTPLEYRKQNRLKNPFLK